LSFASKAVKRWHYSSVVSERSSAWEAVKKGPEHMKLKNLLLEVIAKERPVKMQQARKGLADHVTICELLGVAVAL
jgi:hypothetical protein